MKGLRRTLICAGVAVGALVATGSAGATAPHFGHVTCANGNISGGTYKSLRITGTCTVPVGATVNVKHNVVVANHAFLNQITQSTLNVWGNMSVLTDAVVGLGCNDEVGCATPTDDHIGGNLTATGAWAVVDEQETIGGNVTIKGGGGSEDCSSTALLGGPYFSTIHDSVVGGNVVMRRVHSCWFGLIRTQIGGNATIVGNRMGDPDAMEIVTNTVGGNLGCFNNRPAAQVGDSQGLPNIVGGHKRGECANL
jgi:hypothetical protein